MAAAEQERLLENKLAEINLYEVAQFIYETKVEYFKKFGELRRVSEITNEDELDDHFDDLAKI